MRHKRFNESFPYTYYLTHKLTGLSYYGLRIANYTKHNCSPIEDFGINYFTSIGKCHGWFKTEFIKNKDNFELNIHYTFDTPEEAYKFEKQMIIALSNKKNWLNKMII